MKNLLSLLVCFGLAVGMASLVGCSGDDKKPAADSTKKADSAKKADDAKPKS